MSFPTGKTPTAQLRWVAPDGSLRCKLEGPKAEGHGQGSGRAGRGMAAAAKQAAAQAAGRGGGRAGEPHWFLALLQRAELY